MKPAGVILVGGQSRRMGRDKALLTQDGSTFLQQTVDDMRRVCGSIYLLASPGQSLPMVDGVEIVIDAVAYQGPATALLSFASHCEADWLFVRAVDMPLARASEFIFGINLDHVIDGCIACVDGREQPLFAIYRRSSLLNMKLTGKRSMFQMLEGLSMRKLSFSGSSWRNFNYQDQLSDGVG